MKVGLFVTNQQQLATDMVAALDDQIAMVELARDRGWNSLFTGQHYLNEGDNKQLQAVPFLARLAAVSGEMTIGLGILLLNLHSPVYTAETIATLDVIARGKFVFGVGLGYRQVGGTEGVTASNGFKRRVDVPTQSRRSSRGSSARG